MAQPEQSNGADKTEARSNGTGSSAMIKPERVPLAPPVRFGPFARRASAEEEERRAREEKIRDLLPDEEEDSIGKAYDGRLLRRLLAYLRPYHGRTILALILMSVSSLLTVAGPWLIGRAIDLGIRAGSMEQLRWWTLLFIVAALFEWFTNRGRIAIMAYVGTKIVADL